MERMRDERTVIALGALAAVVLGAVLVPVRSSLQQGTIALLFVPVTVLAAGFGGRRAGIVTALFCVVSFDFFHTQPYLRFAIDGGEDLELAAVLLIVGVLVGGMSTRGRTQAGDAADRRRLLRGTERVTRLAVSTTPVADVVAEAEAALTEMLGLDRCAFSDDPLPVRRRLVRGGLLVDDGSARTSSPAYLGTEPILLPVTAGDRRLGAFTLLPSPSARPGLDERLAAVTLADVVALRLAQEWPMPGRAAG